MEGVRIPCALSFIWRKDREDELVIAEALEALAGVWLFETLKGIDREKRPNGP